ncbi:MAG: group II truncated hemoglobin [Halothiobacillaceae bacterium]|nr:group II truncated hemoglobin [Halothiobacillaceae bacterium]
MTRLPVRTPYSLLGGEDGVRRITRRFYALMDELPSVRPLREVHPDDLSDAEQKLFEFLSGWLGGPQLFMERHGHPRLRMRHMRLPIDESMRDQWMHCMRHALDSEVSDPELREQLYEALWNVADHMRNRASAHHPQGEYAHPA